jgi:hypothetical protein
MATDADNLTEQGARDLAQRIREHWAAKGHVVSTWLVPIWIHQHKVFEVKSSLVAGLPTTDCHQMSMIAQRRSA